MKKTNFDELLEVIDRYKEVVDRWKKLYFDEVKKNESKRFDN